MKPSPSEKLEIIRLVEDSHLPTRRTLEIMGIAVPVQRPWDKICD